MNKFKKSVIRIIAFFIVAMPLLFLSTNEASARVSVKGYFKKNGTYVAPHYRSDPDGIISNNYSYPGNYNPNTGKVTSGGSTYTPTYISPTIPTPSSIIPVCSTNAYYSSFYEKCVCNSGYTEYKGQCLRGEELCKAQYTNSLYLSGKCYYCTDTNLVPTDDGKYCVLKQSTNGYSKNTIIKQHNDYFYVNNDNCLQWIINDNVGVKLFGKNWKIGVKQYNYSPTDKFCDYLK